LATLIAMLLATVVGAAVGFAAWFVDQRLLRCGTAFRAVVATMLAAISTWVAMLIHSAIWLRVPGAYGPVQFWYNDPNASAFMMGPRLLSTFLMIGCFGLVVLTAIATVISFFFVRERFRWRRLVVPVLANGAYALAHYWFMAYEFFPCA
jgi:hypothetical protein